MPLAQKVNTRAPLTPHLGTMQGERRAGIGDQLGVESPLLASGFNIVSHDLPPFPALFWLQNPGARACVHAHTPPPDPTPTPHPPPHPPARPDPVLPPWPILVVFPLPRWALQHRKAGLSLARVQTLASVADGSASGDGSSPRGPQVPAAPPGTQCPGDHLQASAPPQFHLCFLFALRFPSLTYTRFLTFRPSGAGVPLSRRQDWAGAWEQPLGQYSSFSFSFPVEVPMTRTDRRSKGALPPNHPLIAIGEYPHPFPVLSCPVP